MSQYLEFKEVPASALKTKVVDVLSQRSGERLAQIRWYGPWRCYVMRPVSMTIWNEQCLMDVNSYINRLKAERSNRLDDARRAKRKPTAVQVEEGLWLGASGRVVQPS